MIASITHTKPGKISIVIGDAHIYENHIEQVKEQLKRTPREFPTLKIIDSPEKIEDFKLESFVIEEYDPYPIIKAKMAV
jgi:thymidylate synthase